MTEYTTFSVEIEKRNSIVRLVVAGELDLITTPRLIEGLREAEREDATAILLDIRDVSFMDSTGLQAFLEASLRAKSPRHLLFVGVQPAVRRVFEVTGTASILDQADAVTIYTEFFRESVPAVDPAARPEIIAHD